MIIDTLKHAACYHHLSMDIKMGLDYLAQADITEMEPGRYDIKGDDLYVMIQDCQPKSPENGVWEAHRKYIDIQYVAVGPEMMGYAPIEGLEVTRPYVEEKDCFFLDGKGDFFTVQAGMFAVFFPHDAHMPGLRAAVEGDIRKAVVKVRC